MSAFPDLRAEAARLKAAIRLPDIIGRDLPLRREGRCWAACCPLHAERTPSFYVYPDHFHCFGCGAHGDVFDWLKRTRGTEFPAAVAALGGATPRPQTPRPPLAPRPATRERAKTADSFLRCWNEGIDPIGTVVEPYLASRGGLTIPRKAPIRFHPRCQRGPGDLVDGAEYWPAMLALMTDPVTNAPVGLHRTYLRPDGSGKAPDTERNLPDGHQINLKAKRILGTWGVVRLAHDDDVERVLGIAEGIENALTASQVIGWGPVWAAGTRNCIERFPVLRWAEALTIFADADDSGVGLEAARACAVRWTGAGREVLIHTPPTGTDWNDALRAVAR